MPQPHVLIAINTSWNVVNFRAGLVRGLQAAGYGVSVAAPPDRFTPALEALGCRFYPVELQGHGRSPAADFRYMSRMFALLRRERADALLGFTVKPNVYGSLAAHALNIPVINNIAGLGVVFNERGATARIVNTLYRLALRRSHRVFFQNGDDRELFVRGGLVRAMQTEQLPGSGVDLGRFAEQPLPTAAPFTFLLVARLLKEKGLAELAEAAEALRAHGAPVRVRVLGPHDPANPASVPAADLARWTAAGTVEHLGTADDVRSALAAAHCVVLPSYYREGTPRALLEALATGRPVITTDMPGCRDVVDDGVNGFLVPPRDAPALARAMARVAALPPAELAAMGRASRLKAERQYNEALVVRAYLRALGTAGVPRQPTS